MTLDPSSQPDGPTKRSSKRLASVGVAAGVLGGAAIGLWVTSPLIGNAASDSAVTTTVGPADDSPAAQPPAPASEPSDADHTTKLREKLQPLVDDGTITSEQADAVAAFMVENRPERPAGDMKGPGGIGDDLAEQLGLADGAELAEQLRSGKTIAEIAEANGVAVAEVKAYMLDQLTTRVDEAVAAGKIDQATADAKLAEAETHIDAMINGEAPLGGRKGPGPNGPRPGADGDAPNIVEG